MLRTMVGAISMLSFSLVGAILADEAEPSFEKSATLSIVAVDPENGICGAAVASKYPAVGKVVPYVRAGVGAFCTQHWHVPKWGERALDLLEVGKRPEAVFLELLKDDEQAEQRQLGIVDIYGRTAVHNPTASGKISYYFGAMTGRHYTVQGNTLTGREVITAMAQAYEDTKGSLTDRLMAALVAGDCVGGDHRLVDWPLEFVLQKLALRMTGFRFTSTIATTPSSNCCATMPMPSTRPKAVGAEASYRSSIRAKSDQCRKRLKANPGEPTCHPDNVRTGTKSSEIASRTSPMAQLHKTCAPIANDT